MSTADRLLCPQCKVALDRHIDGDRIMWICPRCSGRTVGMGVLRRTVARDYANRLWAATVDAGEVGDRDCPSCGRKMLEAPETLLNVDVCKGCHLVWFDTGEYESAPVVQVRSRDTLPEAAREAAAIREARAIAAFYKEAYGRGMSLDEAILMVSGVLGLPLEEDSSSESIPWATWIMAAVIGATSLYGFFVPETIERLGLVPEEVSRLGGLTFVTAFFFHAGVFQLIANLYFLAVFGDNVEDVLGTPTFVMLVVLGALGGEIAHVVFTDASTEPFVGATGGVSALVVFFGLKFPQAKLRYLWVFGWYTVPASAAVLLWFLANVVGGTQFLLGAGHASPYVYLGGGLTGALLWFALRNEYPVRRVRSG